MNAASSSPSPANTESGTSAPVQTTLNTLANSRRSISSSFRNILLAGPSKPSTTVKSGASSPSSPADHGRRRSIAHRPSILGFDDDDDGNFTDSSRRPSSSSSAQQQQEAAADWHDVSLEFDVERLASDNSKPTKTCPRSSPVEESIPLSDFPPRRSIQDHKADRQYRVDDTVFDADDDRDDSSVPHHPDHSTQTQSYGAPDEDDDDDDDETRRLRPTSTSTSYNASPLHHHHHHHHPLYSAHSTSETAAKLDFQALTRSEKTSYCITTLFVLLLSLVAVGIGSDWIDWPGDGIGSS